MNITSHGPAFFAGLTLSLSLIMAIGPQNAHVLRAGMARQHLGLTVAVCAISDMLLIALGVVALASLGELPRWLWALMLAGGATFLLYYSWQALRRCWRPAAGLQVGAVGVTRRAAFAQIMAFTWLNPHAWLDTAVLIGTASLAHAAPANWVFGAGAAAGSALWFTLWAAAAALAGRKLQGPHVARVLDGAVALLCASAAFSLIKPLLRTLA